MRIFFHFTGANIDTIMGCFLAQNSSYRQMIRNIVDGGSSSMLGFDWKNSNHFLSFSNSEIMQMKWCMENDLKDFRFKNDEFVILDRQIKRFDPDVIFTVNPNYFLKFKYSLGIDFKNILIALWKASPIENNSNYSNFDLGLSFSDKYLGLQKQFGLRNTEIFHFNFNSEILQQFESSAKIIDLSFVGTYNDFMFRKRTTYFHIIFNNLFLKYKIRYHFNVHGKRRLVGLSPNVPLKFLPVYRRPIYLKDFLSLINRSKINFNCHSDITGTKKGNMRVFETLGMKSFLLTDDGIYPPHLEPEKDFITYKNEKDLIDKAHYFLKNDAERDEIASNGYETLKKYYNLGQASKRLESIFIKYL